MNKKALKELTQKCTECISAWKKENWEKPLNIELGNYIEYCRMYGGNHIQKTYEEVWGESEEDNSEVQKALWGLERGLMEVNYEGQDIDRIYFGARIAYLRKHLGLTQQELADSVGIRREHVSRIEAGKYSVGLDVICKIAKALDMELEFISTD